MNFLEICQTVVRECGIDRIDSVLPVSVEGQTGELRAVVDWVRQAYIEIQAMPVPWLWMRKPWTLNTTIGKRKYLFSEITDAETSAPISRFNRWWIDDRENPPKCYLTSAGRGSEYWMIWVPYQYFQTVHNIGTEVQGTPIHIAEHPDRSILIGQTPSAVNTINGEYQRGAQILTLDGDIPEMPKEYHWTIVYAAMKKYATREVSPEIMLTVNTEGKALMSSLLANQSPARNWGGARPLA
jgi:hypothetical protein